MNGRINPTELCKDEREVVRILNDKRIVSFASSKSLKSLIETCEEIIPNCRR